MTAATRDREGFGGATDPYRRCHEGHEGRTRRPGPPGPAEPSQAPEEPLRAPGAGVPLPRVLS